MSARFAIVVGRFYEDLAERLVGRRAAGVRGGRAASVDVYDVPGAYELPLAALYLRRRPAATPAWPASAR